MWLLALLSCVGLMICGTPVQGDPPNRDELQLTTQPVVTAAAAPLFSGAGTETNPYKISSGEDMIALSTTTDYSTYWGTSSKTVYYKLTKDITVTADTWTPIGNGTNKFYGVFDGCGKTITIQAQSGSDITINTVDTGNIQYVGLFGCADENRSLIANLIISTTTSLNYTLKNCSNSYNPSDNNIAYIGYLGGYLPSIYNISIDYVKLSISGPSSDVYFGKIVEGLVAGYGGGCEDKNNELCNISAYGSLYGSGISSTLSVYYLYFGGIVGELEPTSSNTLTIKNCVVRNFWEICNGIYITAYVGGLVGYVGTTGTKIMVSNCLVDDLDVSNTYSSHTTWLYAGGIIGYCDLQSGSSFKHCYLTGSINLDIDSRGYAQGKLATIAAPYGVGATITIEDCLYALTYSVGNDTDAALIEGTYDSAMDFCDVDWVPEHFTSENEWSTDIWLIEPDDPDSPEEYTISLNVAGIYRTEHPVVGTAFTVTFSADTPKGGLFLYVLCIDSTGASKYSEIRQYYFEGANETETIYYELTQGATYKVLISKPYVWEFTIEGTDGISGTAANGQFTFTAPAPDVGGTVTIEASGGTSPNNFAVV